MSSFFEEPAGTSGVDFTIRGFSITEYCVDASEQEAKSDSCQ